MNVPDDYAQAETLHRQAYDSFEQGRLQEAAGLFDALLQLAPEHADYHYMQGLVHKYLRDWPTSLQHNLRALALREESDEASHWNAGIAATALGDWAEARRQWQACGLQLPQGEGPLETDFGVIGIRLNPWNQGETLFARRIDVVRARLLNVPLPQSGHSLGDLVLHDGARTGERLFNGEPVPVFNALARLSASPYRTYVAFVHCADANALEALLISEQHGLGGIEDWTESIRTLCLRCSYGAAHTHAEHEASAPGAWQAERNLGVAADEPTAREVLEAWARQGAGRRLEALIAPEPEPAPPAHDTPWWRSPDEAQEQA